MTTTSPRATAPTPRTALQTYLGISQIPPERLAEPEASLLPPGHDAKKALNAFRILQKQFFEH